MAKEYTVEKINGVRTNKETGKKEYLIKWQGYAENKSTWEPASGVNAPEAIADFEKQQKKIVADKKKEEEEKKKKEEKDAKDKEEREKKAKSAEVTPAKKRESIKPVSEKKTEKKTPSAKKDKPAKKDESETEEDDEEVYVVEKILKMRYTKDGKKEFKIKWENYPESEATWALEEHVNAPELIAEFYAQDAQLKTPEGRKRHAADTPSSSAKKDTSPATKKSASKAKNEKPATVVAVIGMMPGRKKFFQLKMSDDTVVVQDAAEVKQEHPSELLDYLYQRAMMQP